MILFDSLSDITGTGYGGAARNLSLELLGMGVDVRFWIKSDERSDVHIYFGQLYDKHLGHLETQPLRGDKLVFWTMYESDEIPSDWVEKINDMCDLLIVPSLWCAETFKARGVTAPVAVVPLGVSPRDFPDMCNLRELRRKNQPKRPFTYLWQGFSGTYDRKGGDLVEKAFMDAMERGDLPMDDVYLIKKTTTHTVRALNRTKGFQVDGIRSRTIMKNLPGHELLGLMLDADVGISPTAGEGFGLMPLEWMSTGLPTIVPYATGLKEYLPDPDGGGIITRSDMDDLPYIPLDCIEQSALVVAPKVGGDFKIGRIDRPTYDAVYKSMVWAYQNREKLPEIGRRAAMYTLGWDYRSVAGIFLKTLAEHFPDRLLHDISHAGDFAEATA